MEACLKRTGIPCWQTVYEQSYTLTESQECVVPDTLPDIAHILCSSGSALIRSKDLSDGRIRLEANVPVRVSCVGEGEAAQVFCLDVSIPFYLSAQDETLAEKDVCIANLTLRQIDARLLNPRKISVRADLDIRLCCFMDGSIESVSGAESEDCGIHTLTECAETAVVTTVTEKTFVLTDEAALTDALPPAAELMALSADPQVQDIKTSGTKIIISGSVCSSILYRCAEGKLHAFRFRTSFSQIIDAQCEADDAAVDVSLLLSGMYYEIMPGSDGREIAMELHFVAQTIVSENRSVSYLADAYSNALPLEMQRERRRFSPIMKETLLRESGSVLLDTPESADAVIESCASPLTVTMEDGELRVGFQVTLLYESAGTLCSAQRLVTHTIKPELPEKQELQIKAATLTDLLAVPSAGGIELRYGMEIRAWIVGSAESDCISAMTYDAQFPLNTDALPSLVIMKVGAGNSLWELAKGNCSSVEAILAANALEDGAQLQDRLLLIPKAP